MSKMSKANADAMLEKLKQGVDKLKEQPKKAPPAGMKYRGSSNRGFKPALTPLHGASKLSVSLYPPDLQRLDEIKEFMRLKGYRSLSDSEALRLACRHTPIDPQLLEIYRQMQTEDGRRLQ